MIETFDPGRYLRYDEMTALLKAYAEAFPGLCKLDEIGRSHEGRVIWGVTLTNSGTGPDQDKPGYLIDANTHAGEVTGGAAAIYSIHWLLTQYGKDAMATEILDTRAFYVVPRIAVDGVEVYLTTPYGLRSSAKPYPLAEELPGLYPEDVNGDGHILQMRVVHPDGDWKVDEQDSRMMVKRHPQDRAGTFYKIYNEGLIQGWDGKAVTPAPRRWGLDFNRNYPAFWNPEGKQPGAGEYPLSNPETKALATFFLSHPNIGAYVAYHTTGCVLLRPPSNGGDDKIHPADLESFKRIGEMCVRETGYTCKSTYDAFGYPGQEAMVKGADDWAYEHFGVQAFTFELWSLDVRSGANSYNKIGVKGLLKLSDEEIVVDERKRLAYNDKELGGKGFIPWTPCEHPQLGQVEIGGWEYKRCLQNPPEGPLLVEEITKCANFTFKHALALPQLAVELQAAPVGAGIYKLSARVRNVGRLATNLTQMAVVMKAVKPIEVRLEGGVSVLSGKGRQEVGHLGAGSEVWVDWLVGGVPGTGVTVSVGTPRGGRASASLGL